MGEGNTVSERRIHPRIDFREAVQYHFKDPSQFGGCLACDISETGIKVNLNDFVPLGTEFVLDIPLDDGHTVECLGRVVWVQKVPFSDRYQAGLNFEAVESTVDFQHHLRRYIHSTRN